MNALILIAHGSRRTESNTEVELLAQRFKKISDGRYDIVNTAFLELASPSIEQSIDQCIKEGVNSLVILPYFLNSGRHVIEDIPKAVDLVVTKHSNITYTILPHVGSSPSMLSLLIDISTQY